VFQTVLELILELVEQFFKLESFASYFGISNWHVLQHESGKLGQPIYHPQKSRLS